MAKNKKNEIFFWWMKRASIAPSCGCVKSISSLCIRQQGMLFSLARWKSDWGCFCDLHSRRIFNLSHWENVWWNLAMRRRTYRVIVQPGLILIHVFIVIFLCIYEITFSTRLLLTRSDKNQQSVDKKKSWCFYWNVRRSFKTIMLIHWRVCVVGGGAQRNFMNVNVM